MRERGSDKTKHAVVGAAISSRLHLPEIAAPTTACRPFSDVQEKEVYTVPGSKII